MAPAEPDGLLARLCSASLKVVAQMCQRKMDVFWAHIARASDIADGTYLAYRDAFLMSDLRHSSPLHTFKIGLKEGAAQLGCFRCARALIDGAAPTSLYIEPHIL